MLSVLPGCVFFLSFDLIPESGIGGSDAIIPDTAPVLLLFWCGALSFDAFNLALIWRHVNRKLQKNFPEDLFPVGELFLISSDPAGKSGKKREAEQRETLQIRNRSGRKREKREEKRTTLYSLGPDPENVSPGTAAAQAQNRQPLQIRTRSETDPETRQNRPGPKIRRKQASAQRFQKIDSRTESGIRKQDPEEQQHRHPLTRSGRRSETGSGNGSGMSIAVAGTNRTKKDRRPAGIG